MQTSAPGIAFGKTHIPHRLILAPMCGITLLPFRQVCKLHGAGLVFNQMVSAKALTRRDEKSFKMLEFNESERPLGLQLFGNDADTLAEATKILSDQNPDVIDLNLGCPAKKIVNDGGGSALLTDLTKLDGILAKMRKATPLTLTIKIRAGYDDDRHNFLDVLKCAENNGIDAIALHARTKQQAYTGHADWDLIAQLKARAKIFVIGNGDVQTAKDAHRMLKQTGCDAVMTGRGAFEAPWIFANFLNSQKIDPSPLEKKKLIGAQYRLFFDYFGVTGGLKMMRKFLCAYTKGMRDGAEFRNRLVRCEDPGQIFAHIDDFFALQVAPVS